MRKYSDEEKSIIGKTVKDAEIDGFGVTIKFTDGTALYYGASDGGYSTFEVVKESEQSE